MRPSRPFLVAGLVLLAAAGALAADDLEVEAGIEPQKIGVGEIVHFWIEVRTGLGGRPRFRPEFELENLEVAGPPVQSQNFHIGGGATGRTFRLTYPLRPLGQGVAVVHSIRVRLDHDLLELPSQRLEVHPAPPPHRRRPPPRDPFDRFLEHRNRQRRHAIPEPEVFLRAEASPRTPYVGQQVSYALYLYTQANVSSIVTQEIPDFRGFWAHKVPRPQPTPHERVEVDGQVFTRVALLRQVLFPRRAGYFELEPAVFDLVAELPDRRFFPRNITRTEHLRRKSERIGLEVHPLPEQPSGFTGAVGSFRLSGRIEPETVQVGETAALTVTLSGDGHVQSLPSLTVPELPGLEVFPPEESDETRFEAGHLVQERTFTFMLTPRRTGRFRLPPFEVPFYDPSVESYRVAATAPLRLEVEAARPQRAAATGTGTGLHSIRSAAVPLEAGLRWHALVPWLVLLPLGLAAITRLVQGRHGAGTRRLSAPAQHLLERLDTLLEAPETTPRKVAQAFEDAWRSYLAARWGVPATVMATHWASELDARRTPGARQPEQAALDELAALASEIHALRYAPQLSSTESLERELVERSRRLVRRLR